MGGKTGIQWTQSDDGTAGSTWNPIRGCSRVSPGCTNCYAESIAARFSGPGQPYEGLATRVNGHARWTNTVRIIPEHLHDPLRWKRPRRVFVNSMSDLFHEQVPDVFIAELFGVMHDAPQHTFQILTKRPENALRVLEKIGSIANVWPLPNVWIGVSVENQATVDERLPLLVQMPAAVRFLSCEPLLEAIDISTWMLSAYGAIRWVIAGGESGPNARFCGETWIAWLVAQAHTTGAAAFVKQLGSVWARNHQARDGHGGNPDEWPEALRVREFPAVATP